MAMALHAAAEHRAFQDVEGGKQGRRPVAGVVMRLSGRMSGTVGPIGTGAFQSLDLGLFVYGQHDGVGGRIHVETDHILHLLGEGRVVRALEGTHPMRLQAVLLPDPRHGAERDAGPRSDGAASPVSDFVRRFRTGQRQHLRHCAGGMRRGTGWAGLIAQQALDALLGEALLPAPNGGSADASLAEPRPARSTVRTTASRCAPAGCA